MPLLIKILTAIGARDMLAGGGDAGPPMENLLILEDGTNRLIEDGEDLELG